MPCLSRRGMAPDYIVNAMLPINLESLLKKQRIESNRVEFKEGWNPEPILKSICAFANDFDNIGGGYIIIGVKEENGVAVRPVLGIEESKIDKIQRELLDSLKFITPEYRPKIYVEDVDDKQVIVIWAASGAKRPYQCPEHPLAKKNKTMKYFIRFGSSTIAAEGADLQELMEISNRYPFDDRGNAEIKFSDISHVLLADYLNKTRSKLSGAVGITPLPDLLEQMNLMTGPSELRYIRNVAAMMFCDYPEKFFRYTQVEVAIFPFGRVADPNRHITPPFFTGSVPKIIGDVLGFFRTAIIKEHIVKVRGDEHAVRYFNYPFEALEEGIVNALYHRDYTQAEPVEITVEPHQISILSFSGPDRSISDKALVEAQVIATRRYRNRHLGDFLRELDLTEGRATGIPTIQQALAQNGSPRASIQTDDRRSYFQLTIPCHAGALNDLVEQFSESEVNSKDFILSTLSKHMGEGWDASYLPQLVSLLRLLDAPISSRDLQKRLAMCSLTTFRKHLLLPLMENGLVEYTLPNAPKHASQKYRLTVQGEVLRNLILTMSDNEQ